MSAVIGVVASERGAVTASLGHAVERCVQQHEVRVERGPAARVAGLVDWPTVRALLRAHPHDFSRPRRADEPRGRFSLARRGEPVPVRALTRPAIPRTKTSDRRLDLDRVEHELSSGATLLVNDLDSLVPSVDALMRKIAGEEGSPASARLFATRGAEPGFPPHADLHDTLVIQVSGAKHWAVWAPVRPHPVDDDVAYSPRPAGAPAWEGEIRAGDVMLVPRGWWHRVTGVGGESLHLTVDLHRRTGMHVARAVAERLAHRPSVTRPLRRDPSAEADAAVAAMRSDVAAAWRAEIAAPTDTAPASRPPVTPAQLLPPVEMPPPRPAEPAGLDDLLSGTPLDDLLAARRHRHSLHVASDPRRCAGLLPLEDLTAVIMSRRVGWFRRGTENEIFSHGVHFSVDGAGLDPRSVWVPRPQPDGRHRLEIDPELVRSRLASGATLLVNDLQDSLESIGAVADALRAATGDPVRVMAYASWRPVQAFPLHADSDHVLVVQVAGEKHWEVFGTDRSQTDPTWSGTVRAGDLLLIPRGCFHRVRGTGAPSIHLRFGMFARTGLDVAEAVADRMARLVEVRRPLRLAAGAPARACRTDEVADAARGAWKEVGARARL